MHNGTFPRCRYDTVLPKISGTVPSFLGQGVKFVISQGYRDETFFHRDDTNLSSRWHVSVIAIALEMWKTLCIPTPIIDKQRRGQDYSQNAAPEKKIVSSQRAMPCSAIVPSPPPGTSPCIGHPACILSYPHTHQSFIASINYHITTLHNHFSPTLCMRDGFILKVFFVLEQECRIIFSYIFVLSRIREHICV